MPKSAAANWGSGAAGDSIMVWVWPAVSGAAELVRSIIWPTFGSIAAMSS